MNSKITIVLVCASLCVSLPSFGQKLKVEQSQDSYKVDRNAPNGWATIVLDSHVKELSVSNTMTGEMGDTLVKSTDNLYVYWINAKEEILSPKGFCSRKMLLNSPQTAEYELDIEDIFPNHVYYYTVILPDQYSKSVTAEYLFTKSAMHGARVSYGKRFGFYLSYKWGEYKKYGSDISEVSSDYDVTRANNLGYIRTSITGGLKVGLINKEIWGTPFVASLLIGAGYGEYGRQWENPFEVDKNIYFYSDYIKGVESEMAVQCTLYKWITASAGLSMLTGNGNISVDYQLGLGINVNLDNLFKTKK